VIGSGVVEAACKPLVGQRLKLSGMRWGTHGAQAILTMRGWDQGPERALRPCMGFGCSHLRVRRPCPRHSTSRRSPKESPGGGHHDEVYTQGVGRGDLGHSFIQPKIRVRFESLLRQL
jgi:hypothetical protein